MADNVLDIPFIWPDGPSLAGQAGAEPDIVGLIGKSSDVFGVLHGITEQGVARLKEIVEAPGGSSPFVNLIIVLYPTCPTKAGALKALLKLEHDYQALSVRVVTSIRQPRAQNIIAVFHKRDAPPTIAMGPMAEFEVPEFHSLTHALLFDAHDLSMMFVPEPTLAAEWLNWFDVRWLTARPLTERRTAIPDPANDPGTFAAFTAWESYQNAVHEPEEGEKPLDMCVEQISGEIIAVDADGNPVPMISETANLPRLSPICRKLAELLGKGHLVSIDKTTRLKPFEVPVKPTWFGLQTLTQIGAVKRQVSCRISALTAEELKQLENRRKRISELLEVFSYSLADGQRWMPTTAEELFQQEHSRINKEAQGILSKLIANDIDAFLAARRDAVAKDADQMYRNLFPDRRLPDQAIDEIMNTLKERFKEAHQHSFLPSLSFNRVSLPLPQQDAAWKSQLGSSLQMLLSIAKFPRKAVRSDRYFARGLAVKPPQILKAMNVLNDSFVETADDNAGRAFAELEWIYSLEDSELSADLKCEQLFRLLETGIMDDLPTGEADVTHSR